MADELQEPVTEIRITDAYIVRLVTAEQNRTGERSSAKVAGRLISERLAIREVRDDATAETSAA